MTTTRLPAFLTIAMALCPVALSLIASSPISRRAGFHAANTRSASVMPAASCHSHRSIHNNIRSLQNGRRMMMTNNAGDVNQANTHTRVYTTLDKADDTNSNNSNNSECKRDLQQILHTMEQAAYAAGEVALATAGKIEIISTKANLKDLVTESDVECQRLIEEIILNEFPKDAFLGEEDIDLSSGDSSVASSGALKDALGMTEEGSDDKLLFVVDPIDGTTNFQAGLPMYAMSIGAVSLAGSKPEVVAGVIYNPRLDEMTSAVKGRGCYLNNKRINPTPSNTQQPRQSLLGQSLVNVGFPIAKEGTLLASSRAVTALATKVRGLRMIASASQTMAWVAQSKFASYFSWDLNAWDVAAGVVIVTEAGGLVSNFDGTDADISTRDMIITCPPEIVGEEGLLRDELIQVLKDNDCMQY